MRVFIGTKCGVWSAAFLAAVCLYQPTFAQAVGAVPSPAFPIQPDDCVSHAAQYHKVNPWILRAIIQVESSFNPAAVNRNRNGTLDIGIAQINSMHFKELAKYGINEKDLLNGCIASYVAAWHLKKQINAYGNTWFAVGAYHSATKCYNDRYTRLVWNVLQGWGVVTGPRVKPVPMAACASPKSPPSAQVAAANGSSLLALD
jgi:soluble lytic murein transglycosylase-like protein